MIYIVNGRQRQGKTTLAYFIGRKSPTLVIYDPRRQFQTSAMVNPEDMMVALDEEPEITIRPGLNDEGMLDSVCQDILDWREETGEPIALLIDEANLCEMNGKPREKFPHLNYLFRSAGEDDLNIIITAHRPTDVHPDIRSIAHYLCLFRMTHSGDLRAVEEKCGEEVSTIIAALPPQSVLVWNDNVGTFRVHSNRKVWYVSLQKRLDTQSR